ncbi:MAG: aminomethyltransferase [Pseudohongiellaceae bacterium]|jgi:aminomethyltransferase
MLDILKTPLYDQHQQLGARIVDFGGWALPVNYSSQVEEHLAVRNNAGVFDVSHMTVSDITGADTLAFLSMLLANDIHKATSLVGKALYSCMLNEHGGVIDDLIVYYLTDKHCRMVTNAGTNAKDMAWLRQQAEKFSYLTVTEKPQLALVAIQGPRALEIIQTKFTNDIALTTAKLKRFQGAFTENIADDIFIGRTGYTGEDGVEIILPATAAYNVWQQCIDNNIQPCGLGARDTLRLEAGMSLYGADLDEAHTPFESGLSWSVALNDKNKQPREFVGSAALTNSPKLQTIGLILEGKGVLRGHQAVLNAGRIIGEVTSGTFSPSLQQSIAIARVSVDPALTLGSIVKVQIRQKQVDARIVTYPFI